MKRNIIINKTNLINFKFIKDLTNDSFAYAQLDNIFIVVKSSEDNIILIYSNNMKSIISYNMINYQILTEIKNAHDNYITNFRYYFDNINKRDLILSISFNDNNIKLWNIKNWNCLLNIKNVNKSGYLYSACFLNDNNQNYILSSNSNLDILNCESIKLYDFYGKEIREIKGSDYDTYFIDSYFDNNLLKNYLITSNKEYIKSYDYNNNQIYHEYYDFCSKNHYNFVINCNEKNVNLIESSYDGNIRIWDFHSGILLNKIKVSSNELYGICLWDNNYLLAGCGDNTIKLINIKNKNVFNTFKGHKNVVLSLKKVSHPHYGECLISQGFSNDKIKLWNCIS